MKKVYLEQEDGRSWLTDTFKTDYFIMLPMWQWWLYQLVKRVERSVSYWVENRPGTEERQPPYVPPFRFHHLWMPWDDGQPMPECGATACGILETEEDRWGHTGRWINASYECDTDLHLVTCPVCQEFMVNRQETANVRG